MDVTTHDQCGIPFCDIDLLQLLEKDLDFLSVGRRLRDKMKSLGVLDAVWGIIAV